MCPCVSACVFACLCLPTLAVQSSKKQYNPIAMSMLSAQILVSNTIPHSREP